MSQMYKYDAFISYRHTDLDKFAAENIHRQLEAFRLPANIRKHKEGRTKIERVFRDKDELPLTNNLEDPIMEALQNSEYLIVICSPRLRESLWCKKEIETFIGIHGREKVLAVLIEGEPDESFPDELLFTEKEIIKPDGSTEMEKIPMEPLAADIRGKDKAAMKKAMKTELLRLLAPIFGLRYDDLRQRHRERRLKRILAASLTVGAVAFTFGLVSTVMALRIQRQKEQIEVQSQEIQAQNIEIQQQNMQLLERQAITLSEEALRQLEEGDRYGAIATAVSALTEYEGNTMPYTAEAQYALAESLHIYDSGSYIKPKYQLKTAGIIRYMKTTADRNYLVTADTSGTYTIWDLKTGEKLVELHEVGNYMYTEDAFTFLGNDKLVYKKDDGSVAVYDFLNESSVILDTAGAAAVYATSDGMRLLARTSGALFLYDGESLTLQDSYYVREGEPRSDIDRTICLDRQGRYCAFQEAVYESGSLIDIVERKLCIWDMETGKVMYPIVNGEKTLKQMHYQDGVLYLLFNEIAYDGSYMEAEIVAVDAAAGAVVWRTVLQENYGDFLFGPLAEGADKLLLCTSSDAKLISEKDGSVYASFALGSAIVGSAIFNTMDGYLVLTRSGELHNINVPGRVDYSMAGRFQCHSQNVMKFMLAPSGFLVLPYQDNRVTVYEYSMSDAVIAGGREEAQRESCEISYTKAVELAKELGLPKAELAQYIFYNEDRSEMFVYYTDSTLEMYGTGDMTLLGTLSNLKDSPQQYLGRDGAGNFFVGGVSYGYMLNADYKLLAVIENLQEIDAQTNTLYIRSGEGTCYEAPIYTVEELLEKAEEYMLR
ncbi:MAG: toll/interleukin-1 receptor domain-containing protein [Lachnospiraceae bacterium]|nr:toll/interleukin-1 receptor domain-containing protein [Lachnospiraceae bacterium]